MKKKKIFLQGSLNPSTRLYRNIVEADGGEVLNKVDVNRVVTALKDQRKWDGVEKMYLGFGGVKTADDGGRTVIETLYDVKSGGDTKETYAGNDRPELHQTLAGKYQACVEKGATNLCRNSDPATDPGSGLEVTYATNDWGIKYGTHELNGKVIFGDSSVNRFYRDVERLTNGVMYTAQFLIKPDDGNAPSFGTSSRNIARLSVGGTVTSGYTITPYAEGIWHVYVSNVATTNTSIAGIRKTGSNNDVGFEATAIQFEEGSYPTLYIPTTGSAVPRPAPSPVIENALPDTGTVAGVVDMVMAVSNFDDIFDTGGTSGTQRSRFTINSSNTIFNYFYGSDGGSIGAGATFPFSFDDFSRYKFAYASTFDGSGLALYIFWHSTKEIKTLSSGHAINTTTLKDVDLGSQRNSRRFEKMWYKDDIIRVNATDDEIKQFFEDLTRGTSMATLKENMTII